MFTIRQGFRRPAEALLRLIAKPVKSRVFKGTALKRVVPFFVFFLLFIADLTSSGAIFLLSLCHSYVTPKPLCHAMSRTLKNRCSILIVPFSKSTLARYGSVSCLRRHWSSWGENRRSQRSSQIKPLERITLLRVGSLFAELLWYLPVRFFPVFCRKCAKCRLHNRLNYDTLPMMTGKE